MTYRKLVDQLRSRGFTRVERDDRLFDCMRSQRREKGVELWEKWDMDIVYITRIFDPVGIMNVQEYHVPREYVEEALQNYAPIDLSTYASTS